MADAFMRRVLTEVTGRSDYVLASSEEKQGFVLQRNKIGERTWLTIYRNQSSHKIVAFVVQMD